MSENANTQGPENRFRTSGWDEVPAYSPDAPTPRVARVHSTNTYEGSITGTGTAEYALSYGPDGTGSYLGYEQIDGTVDGRAGTFVVEHRGGFDAGSVHATLTVVPRSGTGALAGLTGAGSFRSVHGDEASTYDFTPTFGKE